MPEREHPRGRLPAEELPDLAVRLHERGRGDGGPVAVPSEVAASLHPEDVVELAGTLRVLAALDAPAPELADPPPHLWARIAAESGLEADHETHEGQGAHDETDVGMRPDGVASVHAIGSARSAARGRWWPLAAAATAGLVIGGGAVGAAVAGGPWKGGGDDLLGTAVMASVATDGSVARAEMTRAADGQMHLAVHVPQVPAADDGYLEVWIRDETGSRMISLGTVTRSDAVLTVPEGVDLASYPVLDVSHEHFDGDPSHSTISLWVGEMHRAT